MTKKHFISLANAIKDRNQEADSPYWQFGEHQIDCLADWCQQQNPQFNRERWLAYIAGECGQNGGSIKK